MLRVTLEIVPHGDEAGKRTIGMGEIANLSPSASAEANYLSIFTIEPWMGKHRGPYIAELNNWSRDRTAWDLISALLGNALKGEPSRAPGPGPTSIHELLAKRRDEQAGKRNNTTKKRQ